MAFNPKEGLVYIPAHSAPFAYTNVKEFKYRPGGWNLGNDILANALPDDAAQLKAIKAMYKGQLIAWDPVAGKARWTVEHPFFWNGGVMSTAGGLVFQGAGEGDFVAYEAATGKKVWSFDTGNGIVAAPSTYELDGQQYVALMVGYGGAGPISASVMLKDRPRLPGRLMVFKLGGKATAKPYVIPEIAALDLTQVSTGSGDAKHGFALYHENCQVCHGPSASGAYLPDLRKSQMLLTADNFKSVVLEGTLAKNGMASFSRFLNAKETEDIRAYILTEAKKSQARTAANPAVPPKG